MRFQLKGGNTNQIANYTGPEGELVVSTDSHMVYVQDGAEQGGHPLDGIVHNVNAPIPIAPLNGEVGVSLNPILQGAVFAGDGIHVSSRWQIATDSEFTNIVHDSDWDNVNLISYDLGGVAFSLTDDTEYFYRVAYTDSLAGESAYSNPTSFDTGDGTYPTTEGVKIVPTGNVLNDHFGADSQKISSDGTTLVVGARGRTVNSQNYNGAIYIFTKDGTAWSETQTIVCPDEQSNIEFGGAVDISADGGVIIAGARSYRHGSTAIGRVYIFTKSSGTWGLTQTIDSDDLVNGNQLFGYSVAISADASTIAIGARDAKGPSNEDSYGLVRVLKLNNATYEDTDTLQFPGQLQGLRFGSSVGLSSNGDVLAVGAYGHNGSQGAIIVYKRSNNIWNAGEILSRTQYGSQGNVGHTLAISDDGRTIATGSTTGNIVGFVHIFTDNQGTWVEEATFTGTGTQQGYRFGRTVDLSANGNVLIVGCTEFGLGLNPPNPSAGAAYVFSRVGTDWFERLFTQTSESSPYTVGGSVSINGAGNEAFVFESNASGINGGSLYQFIG